LENQFKLPAAEGPANQLVSVAKPLSIGKKRTT